MPPNPRHRAAPASNIRGIAWTVLAVGLLASIDMLVKFTHAEGVPAMEIVFFRNFFGFLFLAPLLIRAGTTLRSSRQAYMIARGLIHGLAMLGWFTAVTLIPLAEATALSFAVPVFATMGAIIFLRERSRLMRWIPIITGIIGVTVILRPGIEAISLGALLVIGSAVTTAISKLMTKSLARTETATTIVIHLNLTLAIATLLPALLVWSTPSLKALALMAAMGVVAGSTRTTELPSPQLIVAVCVSAAPTSVNVARMSTSAPSLTVWSMPASTCGATFSTVTIRASLVDAPSSSVTWTVTT